MLLPILRQVEQKALVERAARGLGGAARVRQGNFPNPKVPPTGGSLQRRDELRTEPRMLTRGRIRPARIRSARVALVDFQDFQVVPEAPEAQEVRRVPGGLLGLSRRPALLGLQRQDHLFRPLLPQDLEALEAPEAPETNRNHSTQASSPKPRPAIFFA